MHGLFARLARVSNGERAWYIIRARNKELGVRSQESGARSKEQGHGSHVAMSEVEVYPLTAERWADFEKLFGPRGAYAGCWCMWPRLRSKDFNATNATGRKAAMRGLAESGEAPGLLAYVDGQAVGWVALGRRERLEHFEYSRKLKSLDRPEGLWSIACFVIDKGHRRQGLMSRLLTAAFDYARDGGARVVEAYPIDPQGDLKSYHGFTGIASVFERTGFVRVGGTEGDLVVRKVVNG
jgi:GNAT superfamily N-acetyltransferase